MRRPLTPSAHAAHGATNRERFAYDPAGNLLDASLAGPAAQGGVSGYVRDNLVRVFEDKRYIYDGHGRLVRKKSGRHTEQRFEWDDESRLAAVHTTRRPHTPEATTQVTRFEYDAMGRRVAKHDAFGCTRFVWEGLRLIEERRGSRVVSYVYEPGSHVPMARLDAKAEPAAASTARILHFHNDTAGLPEELSSSDGNLCWRASYKTWGATVAEQWEVTALDGRPARPGEEAPQPAEQNLRFQGQYLDRDTGLHYNTFRFYDPDIGRFISPDPIGLEGGDNLHSYAPNPMRWIDPLGWICGETLARPVGFNRGSRNFSLEQGNATSGWKHIYDRHVDPTRFTNKSKLDTSMGQREISSLLGKTLKHGKESSYEGKAVFESRLRYDGQYKRYRATVNEDGTVRTFHPLD